MVNLDLVGRYMIRMAAEIEVLVMQRDTLAEENEKLKQELARLTEKPGPKIVPAIQDPEVS
jgi:hypothetical protein